MVYFPYICIHKRDTDMTTHEISDYFHQSYNMENVYKTEKHIGRLIRSQRFTYKKTRYGDSYDLKYKITYIKSNNNCDLLVNVKVCGTMGQIGELEVLCVLHSIVIVTTVALVLVMMIFVGLFLMT